MGNKNRSYEAPTSRQISPQCLLPCRLHRLRRTSLPTNPPWEPKFSFKFCITKHRCFRLNWLQTLWVWELYVLTIFCFLWSTTVKWHSALSDPCRIHVYVFKVINSNKEKLKRKFASVVEQCVYSFFSRVYIPQVYIYTFFLKKSIYTPQNFRAFGAKSIYTPQKALYTPSLYIHIFPEKVYIYKRCIYRCIYIWYIHCCWVYVDNRPNLLGFGNSPEFPYTVPSLPGFFFNLLDHFHRLYISISRRTSRISWLSDSF